MLEFNMKSLSKLKIECAFIAIFIINSILCSGYAPPSYYDQIIVENTEFAAIEDPGCPDSIYFQKYVNKQLQNQSNDFEYIKSAFKWAVKHYNTGVKILQANSQQERLNIDNHQPLLIRNKTPELESDPSEDIKA